MGTHDTLTPARAKKALERAGISLNERQFDMLRYYITGDDKATACRKSGYPATASFTLFNRPKMRAAVAAIIDAFLLEDAAPAALRALYRIVTDDNSPAGVRVSAANSLLDRAGFDNKRHSRGEGDSRDVTQLTREELQAQIDKLQGEIEGRMRDITPDSEPNGEPLTSQELEMYE